MKSGRVPTHNLSGADISPENEARFWSLVKFDWRTPCWHYQGMSAGGYGKFRVGNVRLSANRVAYALAYGSTPEDLFVLHSCDNPVCVRPDHLSLGTPQDNADDRRERDRHAVGARHLRARLTDEQAKAILDTKGERSNKDAAADFGVSIGCVNHIRNGRTWPHLQEKRQ